MLTVLSNKVMVMEAHKEKMEKVKKEEEIKGSRKKISNEEIETKGDTVSKRVIREFIVSSGGGDNERAQKPAMILLCFNALGF
ncbi:hypothetical protein JHK86_042587 [Glycine max]|nr:hypothetical protein JHK86_042587 [Glycine max]